jgi:hypothetical protein
MIFSTIELLAQERLRSNSKIIQQHPRLCSQGRALMVALGDDIDSPATIEFLDCYRRVLFFGSAEQIEAAEPIWRKRKYSVDSNMIWLSSPAATVLKKLGRRDGAGLDVRFRVEGVLPTTSKSVLQEMQNLQKTSHLVPTPIDFFQTAPDFISTYALDERDEVVGATSCLFLRLRNTVLDRTVLMMNTCVRSDLRRYGFARAMKHHILRRAITTFAPERVGSVVRPTNDASLRLNNELGLEPNSLICFAMVEAPG